MDAKNEEVDGGVDGADDDEVDVPEYHGTVRGLIGFAALAMKRGVRLWTPRMSPTCLRNSCTASSERGRTEAADAVLVELAGTTAVMTARFGMKILIELQLNLTKYQNAAKILPKKDSRLPLQLN